MFWIWSNNLWIFHHRILGTMFHGLGMVNSLEKPSSYSLSIRCQTFQVATECGMCQATFSVNKCLDYLFNICWLSNIIFLPKSIFCQSRFNFFPDTKLTPQNATRFYKSGYTGKDFNRIIDPTTFPEDLNIAKQSKGIASKAILTLFLHCLGWNKNGKLFNETFKHPKTVGQWLWFSC